MKHLVTRRAMTMFVCLVMALIAITSFTLAYTDGAVNATNPILILAVAAALAFTTEGVLQGMRK